MGQLDGKVALETGASRPMSMSWNSSSYPVNRPTWEGDKETIASVPALNAGT